MARLILVTGGAGFIGSHVVQTLLARGDDVVVLDNLNDYYDPRRKRMNLDEVRSASGQSGRLEVVEGDVRNSALVHHVFAEHAFDAVIHLAAMAGVRQSIDTPALYYDVNVNGTLMVLDAATCKLTRSRGQLPTFVLASTSSTYGQSSQVPFVETDSCDRPLAPYAASKRAAEMLGYTYHYLYSLPVNVLRFFSVYGPRGRPDMMPFKVADSIALGTSVPLFNDGQMYRDWTYVSDVVAGVIAAADRPMKYEIFNVGRGHPVLLADFVTAIEEWSGRAGHLEPAAAPDSDMYSTHADIDKARRLLDYRPAVTWQAGVVLFLEWYEQAVRPIRSG